MGDSIRTTVMANRLRVCIIRASIGYCFVDFAATVHDTRVDWEVNSPPQPRRGGAKRRGGVGQEMIFLTSTTPVEASIEASPYRARASRPRLSPPRLRRGVSGE